MHLDRQRLVRLPIQLTGLRGITMTHSIDPATSSLPPTQPIDITAYLPDPADEPSG
jgi:hypothetical protein